MLVDPGDSQDRPKRGLGTIESDWDAAVPSFHLSPDDVHVWRFSLDPNAQELRRSVALLNPEEQCRMERFKRPIHGRRFAAGRGVLRQILGAYLACPPESPEFRYGPNGKPAVQLDGAPPPLEFNLSHSREHALLALTRGRPVGVDIERIEARPAAQRIARRFFAPQEYEQLQHRHGDGATDMFYQLWTAKESLLKAVGAGLSLPLNRCRFDVDPIPYGLEIDAVPELLDYPWTVWPIEVAKGYVAAAAVSCVRPAFQLYSWPQKAGSSKY